MILLKRGKFDGKAMPALTWDEWLWGPEGKRTALVSCGNGHTGSVNPDIHAIAADGMLNPSWVCPFDDCDWHVFAKLEGWQV